MKNLSSPLSATPFSQYEQPEEYSYFDIVADQWDEGAIASIGTAFNRAEAASGERFDPYRDRQKLGEKLGGMSRSEFLLLAEEEVTDAGIAEEMILNERAKVARQERLNETSFLWQLAAMPISEGPQILLEGLLSFGTGWAARLVPRGVKSGLVAKVANEIAERYVARDIAVVAGVESLFAATKMENDPSYRIDQAIMDASLNSAINAGLIAGTEGASRFFTGRRRPPPVGAPAGGSPEMASARQRSEASVGKVNMAHAANGMGRKTRTHINTREEFELELAPAYKVDPTDENWNNYRRGEVSDGIIGEKYVVPKAWNAQRGEQLLVVTRREARELGVKLKDSSTQAALVREGHIGEWRIGVQSRTRQQLDTALEEAYPMRQGVDNFLNPEANAIMNTRRQEFIKDAAGRHRTDGERMARLQSHIQAELADMDEALERMRGAPDRQSPANSKKIAEAQRLRDEAYRDYDLFIQRGSPQDFVWQGYGADKVARLLYKTKQLPWWILTANPRMRRFKIFEKWAQAGEKLSGTNGAMMPNPERPAVESVYGNMKARWAGRWEVTDQKVRDHYARSQNLAPGMSPSRLHVLNALAKPSEWLRKATDEPKAQGSMTWSEFERAVHNGFIDFTENGVKHENEYVQAAVEDLVEHMRSIDLEATEHGVYASLEAVQADIDRLSQELKEIEAFEEELLDEAVRTNRPRGDTLFEQVYDAADLADRLDFDDMAREMVEDLNQALGLKLRYVDSEALARLRYPEEWRQGKGWSFADESGARNVFIGDRAQLRTGRHRMHALLHEISHGIDYQSWLNAAPEVRKAVYEDFQAYQKRIGRVPPDDLLVDLSGPNYLVARSPGEMPSEKWLNDFREYKAEQIAYWLKQKRAPKGVAQKFFKQVSDAYRNVIDFLKRRKKEDKRFEVSPAIDRYMKDVFEGRTTPTLEEYTGLTRYGDPIDINPILEGKAKAAWTHARVMLRDYEGVPGKVAERQRRFYQRQVDSLKARFPDLDFPAALPSPRAGTFPKLKQLPDRVHRHQGKVTKDRKDDVGELVTQSAADVRAQLAARQQELREIQQNAGNRPHMHRMWDMARIDQDPDAFLDMLTEYYAQTGKVEGARQRANQTLAHIRGETTYGDLAGQLEFTADGIPLRPGAVSRRRLDMPSSYVDSKGTQARDFLNPDVMEVHRTYTSKIAGAIEMKRAFGTHGGHEYLQDLVALSREEGVPEDLIEEMVQAFEDLRDGVLGLDGTADDAMRIDNRILSAARALNVMAFMGSVVQTAMIDTGNLVQVAGMRKLFQAMNFNFWNRASEIGKSVRKDSVELMGLANEVTNMTRVGTFTNNIGQEHGKTFVERGLQGMANKFFFWNGMNYFTDWGRTFAGTLAQHEMLSLSEQVVRGTISNKNMARLRSMGVDRDMAVKIWKNYSAVPSEMNTWGTGDNPLRLAHAHLWQDQHLASQVSAALRTEVDNLIFSVNPATRPRILRHEWGRALMLYTTFAAGMQQTFFMRMLQRADGKMLGAAASMVVMGAIVVNMRTPDYVQRDPEDMLFEAVQISGVTGLIGDIIEKLGQATGTQMGMGYLGIDPKPWQEGADPLSMNPITSQWSDLFKAMFDPEATGDDAARAIRYMLPYNNHILFRTIFDGIPGRMQEELGEALGGNQPIGGA